MMAASRTSMIGRLHSRTVSRNNSMASSQFAVPSMDACSPLPPRPLPWVNCNCTKQRTLMPWRHTFVDAPGVLGRTL
ncbi:hypothetical protein [Streptomyces sp. NPDC048419]|uniref:hypothetical protein n=1 Tax=Streptomyces sp. NPDC048419 TaxID=3365547 RepID=UPI0037121F10